MFSYSQEVSISYGLQDIFPNPRAFLGLCCVVFKSPYIADAKRKDLVCKTLGFFFLNSGNGNGI